MFLYNLVIHLYGLVINLASLNKLKAKQWVNGRKNWRENLSKKISVLNLAPVLWVHCSSYGEFEQGRPLIESIKKKHPGYKIVLSSLDFNFHLNMFVICFGVLLSNEAFREPPFL